jgi:hypothetical protein
MAQQKNSTFGVIKIMKFTDIYDCYKRKPKNATGKLGQSI